MSIAVRSFAKINLGLKIGSARADGFHELRTIYQTIALHDVVRVDVQRGSGIEIRCNDPRVPLDESNTCYKVAERVLQAVKAGSHSINARAGQTEVPQGLKPTPVAVLGGTAEAVPFQSQDRFQNQNHSQNQDHLQNQNHVQNQNHFQSQNPLQNHNHEMARGGKVVIEIDKRLPVQGGMGAGSSNAVRSEEHT